MVAAGAVVQDDNDRAPGFGTTGTSPSRLSPASLPPAAAPAPVQVASGLPPLAPLSTVSFASPAPAPAPTPASARASETIDFSSPFAVEVTEVVHDPELDEAVISFANADFAQCEEALQRITAPDGDRGQHAETWLVLFDLYRATGQQQRFESLAVEYAQQFGWSAPQWYSLPKLVADSLVDEPLVPSGSRDGIDVGWVCPRQLDIEAVARLRSQTLQMPLPWVFDWSRVAPHRPRSGDAAVCPVPPLGGPVAGDALDCRRTPVCRAAGVRPHRRARCRPGVLADAAGGLAPGQPGRPV
jgi:hypothetical protein